LKADEGVIFQDVHTDFAWRIKAIPVNVDSVGKEY
jgi:hypothetical protein